MNAPVKTWWELLFEFLATRWTNENLLAAGVEPSALGGAVTVMVDPPTFGADIKQPPVGVPQSRDLGDAHPELVRRYAALKADFSAQTGRELFETCTWRSAEEQARLFQIGRRGIPSEKVVTNVDGVTSKSRHNVYPSEAIDVCVDCDPGPGKHAVWDESAYAPLGPLAAAHGLIWGGVWGIHDYPHLELPAEAA